MIEDGSTDRRQSLGGGDSKGRACSTVQMLRRVFGRSTKRPFGLS